MLRAQAFNRIFLSFEKYFIRHTVIFYVDCCILTYTRIYNQKFKKAFLNNFTIKNLEYTKLKEDSLVNSVKIHGSLSSCPQCKG